MKRSRRSRIPRKKNNGPQLLLGVLLVLALTVFVLTKVQEYAGQTQKITYSAFIQRVEAGDVKKVNVSGQDITGTYRDDSRFETVGPEKTSYEDLFKKHNIEFAFASAGGGSDLFYFLMLGLLIFGLMGLWVYMRSPRPGAGGGGGPGAGLFGMGKSRARMFMPSTIKTKFTDVAGVQEAKEELQDVVDFLKNPKKYERLGAKMTRGVLLVGEPGNGKTLLAKAVAGEAGCPFFSISGSDFIEVFVGVGASRVRDLFAQARKHSPSIVFIDEIDAVGRHRGSGTGGGNDEREQTLNQLLTEMDGFQTDPGSVIVLAATNRVDVLDKALLRPGRFDRRVEVPYPDLQSRLKILQVHAKGVKMDPAVDLNVIARGTPGFTGADLANLINEAAIAASKNDQKTIIMGDFEEARDKVLLGKEVKSRVQTPEDLKITAFHEAGHAMVRLLMPKGTDPLHKVTIAPRGHALGVTFSLPEKEKYSRTKDELIANIMFALGGRVAEDIVFDSPTTGAYSDFKNASAHARAMVCQYGMSDLGLITYDDPRGGSFSYSQKTAELIDAEVKKIMTSCQERVEKLLHENRDKLDTLAAALLEKETLQAQEIYELLDITPRVTHEFVKESTDENEAQPEPVTDED